MRNRTYGVVRGVMLKHPPTRLTMSTKTKIRTVAELSFTDLVRGKEFVQKGGRAWN